MPSVKKILRALTSKEGIRILSLLAVIVAWQLAGSVKVLNFFISQPTSVAQAFVTLAVSGALLKAFTISVQHLILGFGLAAAVGIPLGLAMGMFKRIEWSLDHYVTALYVSPTVAFIPLIILLFGPGLITRIVTVFIFAIQPMLITTSSGVKNVDLRLVEAARSFGAKSTQLFYKVYLPGTFPFIVSGLRHGVGQAFRAMVLADIFVIVGLGGMVETFGLYFDVSSLFAAIITILIMGIALLEVLRAIEKKVLSWRAVQT